MGNIKTRHLLIGCLCILLLAQLVWLLAGDSLNLRHPSEAWDLVGNIPDLDSFSEPSVGLAVLKLEAERLVLAYHEIRNQEEISHWAALHDSAAAGPQGSPGSVSNSSAPFIRPAAREDSALKRMAKLHAEVQDLEVYLNRNLMAAYSLNDSCSEFLDCYLRLLHQAPKLQKRHGMQDWTWSALQCARKCGRAEEVADALQHVVRFQRDLSGAETMRAILEQLEAENLAGPKVSKR